MKIKILYSHLNVTKTDFKARPKWFDFERCFQNLLRTTVGHYHELEIHVIYDTTRGGIEQNWINKRRHYPHLQFHEIQGGSMEVAAIGMYKIAKELSLQMEDDDIFYFLENDYLHVDKWVEKVKALFSEFDGLNYISLYDHNDKYFLPQYNDLISKIIVTSNHHWRTTPSTCGSYLCNKKTFLEDYDIHTKVMGDHNKWMLLGDQGRFVISAIPGLSTHCMEGLMSPAINWEEFNTYKL
jgi:hypothetical protein